MADKQPATELKDRITRLEETEAFAERTVEQLSAELASLNRRMTDVLTRLERLESRVERMMGTVTQLSAHEADIESPLPTPPDDPHRPVGGQST